jgi:glycine C-acetyltransferase
MMLRIIPTASHTMDDVKMTIKAFEEVAEKLKNGVYVKNLSNISA